MKKYNPSLCIECKTAPVERISTTTSFDMCMRCRAKWEEAQGAFLNKARIKNGLSPFQPQQLQMYLQDTKHAP